MYVCMYMYVTSNITFLFLQTKWRDTSRAEQTRIFCSCVVVPQVLLYALFLDKPAVVCRRMVQRRYRKFDKGIYFKTVSYTRTPCFNLPSQCLIDRIYFPCEPKFTAISYCNPVVPDLVVATHLCVKKPVWRL
jgi:hypothetical protein